MQKIQTLKNIQIRDSNIEIAEEPSNRKQLSKFSKKA